MKELTQTVSVLEEDIIYTGKQGQPLLRVYPIKSDYSSKTYILNGNPMTAEELLNAGYAKSVLGIKEHKEGEQLQSIAMYLDPTKIEEMR